MPLLRCTVLCWIATGCTDGIIDYETGGDIPYTNAYPYTRPNTSSYTRPNTSSYTQPNTSSYTRPNTNSYAPSNTRIGAYRTLIRACKEHLSLTEEVEKLSYKEIKKAYRKFSLKNHPDKRGDAEIFKAGGGAWRALNDKLKNDSIDLGSLKRVEEALLTHLATHP